MSTARPAKRAERGVLRVPVREDGLWGTFYRPDSPGPLPPALVLGGGEGGLVDGGARALAAEGYAALSLGYFGVGTLPRDLLELPLEYFAKGLRWLRGRPEVGGARASVLGTSRGGELALLLGAAYGDDVGFVVGYVPSSVVYGGYSLDPRTWSAFSPRRSSWTLGGRPLPFVDASPQPQDFLDWSPAWPVPWPAPRYPVSLRRAFERPLARGGAALSRAAIPVEKIRGPVLLVSGERDALWPSSRLAEMAVARLKFNRHPYPYAHLRYEEAGHMILMRGVSPSYVPPWLDVGGSTKADRHASTDSWEKVLAFLGEHAEL